MTQLRTKLSIVLVTMLAMLMPSFAQDGIEPFVVVPDQPGGGVRVNGCFRATQNLFGPYRLTLCLERPGTYDVRGGGLRCDGRLVFRTVGRDIHIDLRRTSCGRGRAWEVASIECRHTGGVLRLLGIPRLQTLRCTYFPSVRGVDSRSFTARRI
jgi:hypothetical protein